MTCCAGARGLPDDEREEEPGAGGRSATTTRRAAVAAAALVLPAAARSAPALAVPTALLDGERAAVELYEKASLGVAVVVDVTIPPPGAGGAAAGGGGVEGNGSGVVWDREGNVVTNYHVLGGALALAERNKLKIVDVAKVTLTSSKDGSVRTFNASLVGTDIAHDLAVVNVGQAPPEFLEPLAVSDAASRARVGQAVFAIGSPFGFRSTFTTGVVSGVDREIQSIVGSRIAGGLQVDAAINPGNSGGPLLDASGRLLGINTAIFTNAGVSAGVGFAIPADVVRRVVTQLIEFGKVVTPTLGVTIATPSVAKSLKVDGPGALVQTVKDGSAAAKAGVRPTRRELSGIVAGDLVVRVDGAPVRSEADLFELVEQRAVGDVVTLAVRRDGEDVLLRAALEATPP